jgi:hypothetical protein
MNYRSFEQAAGVWPSLIASPLCPTLGTLGISISPKTGIALRLAYCDKALNGKDILDFPAWRVPELGMSKCQRSEAI